MAGSLAAGPHTSEDANAHRADERLPLSDLHKATEVVALALLDLLGRTLIMSGGGHRR
jgi:succinyl-diaminopimelate desuccinylase